MPESFPRSAGYDPAWVAENWMGPNVLRLTESLSERIELRPGMRVMDLGCGKAISSIFLAREFEVEVWATDLWIRPEENWGRIREAELEGRVHPIYAEARRLPYAHEFFDAIVSMDAFHYFGTDDLYLENVVRFLKPGGELGIVCPGYKRELDGDDVPEYLLEPRRRHQWHSFHSPAWWRSHWEKTGAVKVTCADEPPEAWEIWKDYAENPVTGSDTQVVLADGGALLSFSRVVATKLPPG